MCIKIVITCIKIILIVFNCLRLLLGVMSITGFLSLWISNVASASMMLPIIMAMVIQLAELDKTFAEERPKTQNIPINSQFALTQGKFEHIFNSKDNRLFIE
jgi:hypothetical protein